MSYSLYILKSNTSSKIYIGKTQNLSHKLLLHNTNQVLSTKHKGPWSLIYQKEFSTRSDAMKLEAGLKKWKNPQRILSWINKQTSG